MPDADLLIPMPPNKLIDLRFPFCVYENKTGMMSHTTPHRPVARNECLGSYLIVIEPVEREEARRWRSLGICWPGWGFVKGSAFGSPIAGASFGERSNDSEIRLRVTTVRASVPNFVPTTKPDELRWSAMLSRLNAANKASCHDS